MIFVYRNLKAYHYNRKVWNCSANLNLNQNNQLPWKTSIVEFESDRGDEQQFPPPTFTDGSLFRQRKVGPAGWGPKQSLVAVVDVVAVTVVVVVSVVVVVVVVSVVVVVVVVSVIVAVVDVVAVVVVVDVISVVAVVSVVAVDVDVVRWQAA